MVGAIIGGTIGFYAFFWIAQQGFYALALPPGLLGLGAGLCAGRRSTLLALICGVAGLALGLFTEWRFAPFVADQGLPYFLSHVHQLRPFTLIMLALGTFLAYWLALARHRGPEGVR